MDNNTERVPSPDDPVLDINESSRCPFTGGAIKYTTSTRQSNRDWWPNSLDLEDPSSKLFAVRSDGRGFQLRGGVQVARTRCSDQGPAYPDDRLAGMVAGGLRPLWTILHPHGMACGGHIPNRRRPRRRRERRATFRPHQQLARQRQSRQGTSSALADQAEIRP